MAGRNTFRSAFWNAMGILHVRITLWQLYGASVDCTKEYVSMMGSLSSEHYPSPYVSNTDCLYSILPAGNPGLYKLAFHDIRLPSDGDFVEVTEGSTGKQLGLFTTPGPVPILVGDSFIVRFKTNAAGNDIGFSLSWSRKFNNSFSAMINF
ncbi:hypothetical protein CHS0354_038033 [Potamilus streckersoni]|uniref:CUB domain-containing protein n=1 Tax=Potamilus streckersoni TaxID=2493646 RepID=A0AAE0SRV1_9BIVA|nr:hypothetical protein CHS0354_038033 [Potamilus streckersoni]